MKLEAVIFDLDGTLLDTLDDLADSCNGALNEAGLPSLPLEEYKIHVGSGVRKMISSAIASSQTILSGVLCREEDLDNTHIAHILKSFKEIYACSWSFKTTIYQDILKMLADLREKNFKIAVLSNKPDNFTQLMVNHYFPGGFFDIVYGLPENWPAKPQPDLALHICKQLDVNPENTALVGDSGSDMETALRAGMYPLGVLWGFRDAQELKKAGAAKLFDSVVGLRESLLASF